MSRCDTQNDENGARKMSAGEDTRATAGHHPSEHKSLAGDPGQETGGTREPGNFHSRSFDRVCRKSRRKLRS
jgi:hypothetical protein